MDWYANPQWWAIIALGAVAIFQNWIRSLIWKPKLKISIKLEPPDSHRVPLIDPKTHGFISYSYYFRFRIENTKNRSMKNTEVMITDLYKKDSRGEYEKDKSFLPLNLKWSYFHTVNMSKIQPKVYKHCDFGHIITAQVAKAQHYDLPEACQVVFHLDTAFKPTTGTFLLLPGDYRVRIVVAADNIKAKANIYNLVVKDKWTDNEQEMLRENVSIKEVKSLY